MGFPFRLVTSVLLAFSLRLDAQGARPFVQAEISRVADTAHLEFKGLKSWRYDFQKQGGKKFTLTVPAFDQTSVTRLKGFSDALIESVDVNTNGPDGNYVITFATTSADVESFDYLTDEPSRLILDFYRKPPEEKKLEAAALGNKGQAGHQKSRPKKIAQKSKPGEYTERKPAGDEFITVEPIEEKEDDQGVQAGIFDGADDSYDRFRIKDYEIREEAIISSKYNIYLPFPMLKMKVSQLDRLLSERPEFVIHPKDSRENKEARLLLTLFERKRFAVFLKTYDYFLEKYPESEYLEILKNLTAHVYLQRWRENGKISDFDHAKALYSELVQKFPGSPLREYNYLVLGYAQMELGDAISTLQTFQGFLKDYPKSSEIPRVHTALAEAYLILAKYDEASGEYQIIAKDYPKTDYAREANYRLGDVSFAKGDYNQAIKLYEAAIKQYPDQEKVYPNAGYNMAEARFWQKEYKAALNNYVNFVNLYPRHEYGGYALTRIGELLGIMGADQRRVMGAFLESYFRFPNHPGAKIARLRMLSQQMRGMKAKELKKSLEEIQDIEKKLTLPGINEFTTLMVAEGLSHRGQYQDALSSLISYYQKNPLSANQQIFRSRILRNIANEMKDEVDKGSFMEALEFNSKYSSTWLRNVDRIDIPFLLGSAYENAGAYSEAQKIYRSALEHRARIVGTQEEKERKVQEHLPSVGSLNLRIAATQAQDRNFIEAYQNLKQIGAGPDLSPEESVERVQLTAQIAEQRNEPAKARDALLELAKHWQGDAALVSPVHLHLAQLYLKMNDPKQAEIHADQALAGESSETKLSEKTIADALTVKGDALLAQKKPMAAVESYQKLLERFESTRPLASVRYRVGQILFDRGDLKGASDVWARLQGTPQEFLWKIGQEKLADSQWRDDYNKYTGRIPAMATKGGKK